MSKSLLLIDRHRYVLVVVWRSSSVLVSQNGQLHQQVTKAPRHRGFGGLGRGKRSLGPTAVANEARAYREAGSESQLTPPALEQARYRGQGVMLEPRENEKLRCLRESQSTMVMAMAMDGSPP